MNTPSSSVPPSTNTVRPNNVALTVAAILLSSCSIPKEIVLQEQEEIRKPLEMRVSPVPLEQIMKQLERELTADITEKIQNDPEFHSLEKIQHYLEQEIQKRGLTGIVSLQIAPFIPDGKGGLVYLMVSIMTPQGDINMRMTTTNEEKVTPELMDMLEKFEQELQICVLTTCLEEIERTQGMLRVDMLEAKIHQSLENMAHKFLQHGLQYAGIELINNKGEIECKLKFFDIRDNQYKYLSLPTGIKIQKPERKSRESGQTMIA